MSLLYTLYKQCLYKSIYKCFATEERPKMKKKGQSNIISMGIAIIVLVVIALIAGSVENGLVFNQTLTSTIGNYLEPLALLSGLALAGYMGYRALK